MVELPSREAPGVGRNTLPKPAPFQPPQAGLRFRCQFPQFMTHAVPRDPQALPRVDSSHEVANPQSLHIRLRFDQPRLTRAWGQVDREVCIPCCAEPCNPFGLDRRSR